MGKRGCELVPRPLGRDCDVVKGNVVCARPTDSDLLVEGHRDRGKVGEYTRSHVSEDGGTVRPVAVWLPEEGGWVPLCAVPADEDFVLGSTVAGAYSSGAGDIRLLHDMHARPGQGCTSVLTFHRAKRSRRSQRLARRRLESVLSCRRHGETWLRQEERRLQRDLMYARKWCRQACSSSRVGLALHATISENSNPVCLLQLIHSSVRGS
jgi:hypothetical protein